MNVIYCHKDSMERLSDIYQAQCVCGVYMTCLLMIPLAKATNDLSTLHEINEVFVMLFV